MVKLEILQTHVMGCPHVKNLEKMVMLVILRTHAMAEMLVPILEIGVVKLERL